MRFKDELALTGDGDAIWRRVSDLGAIPTYWVAIRSVEFVRRDEDESIVNIEFVFGGRSEARITVDQADRTLLIFYTAGALTGTHRASVNRNRLVVELDVTFHGTYRLLSPLESERFRSEARQALERLVAPESENG
ncbi:MAG: SRPBCC family protein [Thaumarchaeota archaeon]|nr:SRPBCC family protein [Nitrososphaerota archaeon]